MASFVLSFFQLGVLDEIWDLSESVSEGFLTYSTSVHSVTNKHLFLVLSVDVDFNTDATNVVSDQSTLFGLTLLQSGAGCLKHH